VTINRGRFYKLAATLLVAMIGYPRGVSASGEGPGASMFSFSGFGTLGAVHSSEDHADFTSVLKPNGAGYTHRWSTDVDSRIAGQINARFTSQLSKFTNTFPDFHDALSAGVQTDATGSPFAMTTPAGKLFFIYQTVLNNPDSNR
jgi:hypothetical protein